jgi:hypothetical protein
MDAALHPEGCRPNTTSPSGSKLPEWVLKKLKKMKTWKKRKNPQFID